MKVRRKIYEGLIAQCEALAAALHEEKSKRQLWTRKYYTLLLGIESARREAGNGGTDAAATRFGSEINGAGPALDAAVGITGSGTLCRVPQSCLMGSAQSETKPIGAGVCEDWLAVRSVPDPFPSPFDPDGFYTATALNTLEAFGALPCRTVASAYCDAPPTVALTTDLTRPVLSGGDGPASPLPPAGAVCNAFLRNAREPLSLDTTIINSAV